MTSSGPRTSVVMCTFNGVQFLAAQCASVLSQTELPHEIVVSDDGSTDGTVDVLREWSGRWRDAGIDVTTLLADAPSGVAANFERALAQASGDLILLSDQDDEWLPHRVARSREALSVPGVDVFFANAELIDQDSKPLGRSLFDTLPFTRGEQEAFDEGAALDVLLRRNVATGATMAVRAELVHQALPIPHPWIHDEWLVTTAAALGHGSRTIAYDVEPVVRYRIHGGNAIGVQAPTLAVKWRRMTQPRGERLQRLASRAVALESWAQGRVGDEAVSNISAKREFESGRAGYPASRPRRIRRILNNASGGAYQRWSSQGRKDLLRDAIQPA